MSSFLETIKAVDGEIYNLEYHQKRYEKVLSSINQKKHQNLQDFLSPPYDGIYRCRLVYNENNIDVEYIKYTKRNIETLKLVYDNYIEYSKKSTSREKLDDLFEKRDNCSDVLIVKNELLTDTTIANIALYNGKEWLTPKTPLLNGTTRQRLLDKKKIVEADINVRDIYEFEKIALLNAMIDFDIIRSNNLKDIIC